MEAGWGIMRRSVVFVVIIEPREIPFRLEPARNSPLLCALHLLGIAQQFTQYRRELLGVTVGRVVITQLCQHVHRAHARVVWLPNS